MYSMNKLKQKNELVLKITFNNIPKYIRMILSFDMVPKYTKGIKYILQKILKSKNVHSKKK